jgi:serine/threonine protein phosphatase PrpC
MLNSLLRRKWCIDGDSKAGPVRDHNEDCIASCEDVKRSYAIVCDGVGGHNAGEVASLQATDFLKQQLAALAEVSEPTLRALLQQTHNLLCDAAEQDAALCQMATTVVLAVQSGRCIYIAWVGDSRAYHLRGDQLQQLTQDHSFVAEKIAQGVLTEEEASHHPMASTITSALGGKRKGLRHRGGMKLRPRRGDSIILMSDGVFGVLSEQGIVTAAKKGASAVTSAAIECGSQDNVSAVILRLV